MYARYTGNDVFLEPIIGNKVEKWFEGAQESSPIIADKLRAGLPCEGEHEVRGEPYTLVARYQDDRQVHFAACLAECGLEVAGKADGVAVERVLEFKHLAAGLAADGPLGGDRVTAGWILGAGGGGH